MPTKLIANVIHRLVGLIPKPWVILYIWEWCKGSKWGWLYFRAYMDQGYTVLSVIPSIGRNKIAAKLETVALGISLVWSRWRPRKSYYKRTTCTGELCTRKVFHSSLPCNCHVFLQFYLNMLAVPTNPPSKKNFLPTNTDRRSCFLSNDLNCNNPERWNVTYYSCS